jgi:hypothetical protein
MAQETIAFQGKGIVRARKLGAANALLSLGNVSKLEISFDEEKKELKNYMTAGGGVLDSYSRITNITLDMTSDNFDPEALSRALRGTVTAVAGGAVVDEAHNDVVVGGFVPFNKLPDTALAVTVKKGATTLTVDTDYTLEPDGVTIKSGGTLITGDDILISYTALASTTLEALTVSGDVYELVFSGLNEVRSGKAFQVTAHRVKFGPMKGFGLIADEYGEYEMSADILADVTKTGNGVSQYFNIKAVN